MKTDDEEYITEGQWVKRLTRTSRKREGGSGWGRSWWGKGEQTVKEFNSLENEEIYCYS